MDGPRSTARSATTPAVALPWGSRSTRRVGRSAAARAAARLTAVVVLPPPPFWFTTLRTRATPPPCFTWNIGLALRCRDYKKRPMDPQPEALPDQAHPAHGSPQRAFARAERDHRVARRREEWSGQPHRRRGLHHGPHGHGAERRRHPGLPGEGLGPRLADLRPVQPESPDDVPHEVRTAAIGLY